MKTFKEFLRESTRTKEVDVSTLIRWADEHASAYLKGGKYFYRGSKTTSGLAIGSSAGAFPRRSKDTFNNYTLWIDGNPMFKGFPKRSLSWIASDQLGYAKDFGHTSIVVLADDAKIGLVNHDDMWFKVIHEHTGYTMELLNTSTQFMMAAFNKKLPTTYDQLAENLKDLTIDDIESLKKYAVNRTPQGLWDNDTGLRLTNSLVASRADDVIKMMHKEKASDMFSLWVKLVNPAIFDVSSGADIHEDGEFKHGEVWIEGEAAFIPVRPSDLTSGDTEALTEWMKKYSKFEDVVHEAWHSHAGDY